MSSAEGGDTTPSIELNPRACEVSKLSVSVGSSHASQFQVTRSCSLTNNALIFTANTLQGWDLNFSCNSGNLGGAMRAAVYFLKLGLYGC